MTITARLIADPTLHTDTANNLAARHWCSTASVSTARRISREAAVANGEEIPVMPRGRPRTSATPRTPARWRMERAEVVAFLRGLGLGEAADRVEAGEHVGGAR